MIQRRCKRKTVVGSVVLGQGEQICIQSMTKVFTTDVDAAVEQINKLVDAGCGLVRLAVPTKADTAAFGQIVDKVHIPLVADVHFSADRAVEAIEAGAAKIRLNPGNVSKTSDIERVIDAARQHKAAIRIGVNEASIRDLKNEDVPVDQRVELMLAEMKSYVTFFEEQNFSNIVLSAKSSDSVRTIEINRLLAENFDYPIHLGLTHAGLPEDARIPSAVTIGTLLAEGIGDTIRVSVAGDPEIEAEIAKEILIPLGLYPRKGAELVVCPTCGRTQIDVVKLAREVKEVIKTIDKPIRVAVMGCVVNGPGEAVDADIAVCAGKDKGYLYKQGERIAVYPSDKLLDALKAHLADLS
jgi:(E)-4-hydroxy-3-methylbut-2-enyl-diphosphate synthase